MGQPVVRGAAWLLLLIATVLRRKPPSFAERPVWLFLLVMILLTALQLVPLPPSVWETLPGRSPFINAAVLAGVTQPWRPLSLVPSATLNALSSLVIPLATLAFAAGVQESERKWLPPLLLAVIFAAMLLGLLQFSGASLSNPFIDEIPGQVGGIFANRNHFALLMAFGILLVPAWVFSSRRVSSWQLPTGFGMIVLFLLTILATGSRAGLILGLMALAICLTLATNSIRSAVRKYPRWASPLLIVAIIAMIVMVIVISISADRAASISRLMALDPAQDLRRKALPTVWTMIWTYFPAGTGMGNFATMFKIHEPKSLLSFQYFNRAHNDYLEVLVNAGLPGLSLICCALLWWFVASVRVWRAGESSRYTRAKIGSAMLLLVFGASVFDYPARTPTMMAMITLAALWLHWGSEVQSTGSALPVRDQSL